MIIMILITYFNKLKTTNENNPPPRLWFCKKKHYILIYLYFR